MVAPSSPPPSRSRTGMGGFPPSVPEPAIPETVPGTECQTGTGRPATAPRPWATDFGVLVIEAMSPPRHNLPLSAGEFIRFVGRERDIVDLGRLLDTARMVTLTGTGGIGKTRLALHLAERVLRRFPDGVRFIDLSEASTHEQALRTVAAGLHAVQGDSATLLDGIITALRTQHLLLLLDTCEHAVGPMAELCQAVLRDCPRVRILATSRQPLHVPEENIWRVPPLSLPSRPTPTDPYAAVPVPIPRRDAQRYESVRLFLTRAHAARSGFEMTRENSGYIAEICRMLDGMPLAIELAAARVRVLSVQQILRRLDDRFRLLSGDGAGHLPERQRTLRAVLEWSHGMLTDAERALLHRLSVFSSWYLEMAEEVCSGESVEATDILPLHFSLLDKSLVVMDAEIDGTAHYRLTETVRAYAAERLVENGDGEERWSRYLAFTIDRLERAAKTGEGPLEWSERLGRLRMQDHHRENHARVVLWALAKGRSDDALRVCVALRSYWLVRDLTAEGSRLLEQALDSDPDSQSPPLRARALALRAELRLDVDPAPRVATLALCALEAARACRDAGAAASALATLAALSLRTGALEEGERRARRSLEWVAETGDHLTEGIALRVLARLARRRGCPEEAIGHLEAGGGSGEGPPAERSLEPGPLSARAGFDRGRGRRPRGRRGPALGGPGDLRRHALGPGVRKLRRRPGQTPSGTARSPLRARPAGPLSTGRLHLRPSDRGGPCPGGPGRARPGRGGVQSRRRARRCGRRPAHLVGSALGRDGPTAFRGGTQGGRGPGRPGLERLAVTAPGTDP